MKRDWKTQNGIRTRLSHGCRCLAFFSDRGISGIRAVVVFDSCRYGVQVLISGDLGITRSREHVDGMGKF